MIYEFCLPFWLLIKLLVSTMSKSNLITNTGHRFISKGKTAFKIHIHTPDDTVLHRSVGFVRIGEKKGLKKAIKLRNELGREMWGKFWRRLLKDPYLMTRLPHSVEPKIVHKPNPTLEDPDNRDTCYIAKWREFNDAGEYKYKTVVRSINKYGKLAAYMQTKKALLDAHKDNLEILTFMGRLNSIDLK
ncbi:Fe3+-citrate ABC transporter substrate-binding protein [Vibrio campbellii]|nr:Fe3+-citrate ABC transporter substrate-binding protein [Vibrio campbellii]